MYCIEDLEVHYDKIYKYCHYKLQRKELAEDITQETFLRFFQKKYSQFGETPLKLLYTIARNLCIDEGRKRTPLSLEGMELQGEQVLVQRAPEETILTNHMLKAAMDRLEETERDIVFLHLVNEEPIAVIAKMLGLSRYAVYRRYAHATAILRKELE